MSEVQIGRLAAGGRRTTTDETPPDRLLTALEAIAAYIPAASLGAYIAASALVEPVNRTDRPAVDRLVVFALALGVALFLALAGFVKQPKTAMGPVDKVFKLAMTLLITAFALSLYASALPTSPFAAPSLIGPGNPDSVKVAGVLAIFVAPTLPVVASLLGLRPTNE